MESHHELVNLTDNMIKKSNKLEQRVKNIEFSLIEMTRQLNHMSNHIFVYENYFLQKKEIEFLELILNFIEIAKKHGLELKI